MTPGAGDRAASGNNARVYRLDSGLLKAGHAADIVLLDAPDGGTQDDALGAIRHGDIAAIGAVVTAGMPRFVGRSRNTPATTRKARVAKSTVMQDFAAAAHRKCAAGQWRALRRIEIVDFEQQAALFRFERSVPGAGRP